MNLTGYKTVLVNLLLGIVPVLQGLDVTSLTSSQQAEYAGFVVMLNLLMRFFTKTPVFSQTTTPVLPNQKAPTA